MGAENRDGVAIIAAERRRQIRDEGWTRDHDVSHHAGVLAQAAATYATLPERRLYGGADLRHPIGWPLGWDFKPTPDDRVRELAKAGALIAAEIDRIMASRRG